jgi:hypothetical protein
MTRPYFYFLLFLGLFITSCQPDEVSPEININISDELQIELWEVLDPNQRELELRVSTLELLGCENYSISFSSYQTTNNSIISINNIVSPNECVTGQAPASSQVDLGQFSEGDHSIELNLKDSEITNLGLLKVRQNFYELEMESDHGIFLPWKVLNSVPEDLLWGYLIFEENADQVAIIEAFNTRMAPWIDNIILFNGEYGHFNVENRRVIEIKDRQKTISENLFVFKQTGPSIEIKAVLDDLRSDFSEQFSFRVLFSDGSSF